MAWSIDFISQANEVVRACEWAKADLTCPTNGPPSPKSYLMDDPNGTR